MWKKRRKNTIAFHTRMDGDGYVPVSTGFPHGDVKNYPRALMLELMSRIVAAMSGLIFIRSSILRIEESTVAWLRSSN